MVTFLFTKPSARLTNRNPLSSEGRIWVKEVLRCYGPQRLTEYRICRVVPEFRQAMEIYS